MQTMWNAADILLFLNRYVKMILDIYRLLQLQYTHTSFYIFSYGQISISNQKHGLNWYQRVSKVKKKKKKKKRKIYFHRKQLDIAHIKYVQDDYQNKYSHSKVNIVIYYVMDYIIETIFNLMVGRPYHHCFISFLS